MDKDKLSSSSPVTVIEDHRLRLYNLQHCSFSPFLSQLFVFFCFLRVHVYLTHLYRCHVSMLKFWTKSHISMTSRTWLRLSTCFKHCGWYGCFVKFRKPQKLRFKLKEIFHQCFQYTSLNLSGFIECSFLLQSM